jgi:Fe2+ transport system protein FeoA
MSDSVSTVALSTLVVGQRGRVTSFTVPPEQRQRLLEMGLTTGAECEVVRFAPLGDPMEIKVRGYYLSLRKKEAAGVQIEQL